MIHRFTTLIKSLFKSVYTGIKTDNEMQRIKKNHPRWFKFFANRLDRTQFTGLPLTLLGVAFICALLIFFDVTESVIFSETVVKLDGRVANLMVLFRSISLIRFFLWFTLLGKLAFVVVLMVLVSVLFWVLKKKSFIYSLWITVLGSQAFTYLGKVLIHRPRPITAVYHETSASFPSGHATVAVALYGFLIYLLLGYFKKRSYQVMTLVVGLAVIFLIGFSRIYLTVHYVSDVAAGYLSGLLWLIIGISINEWRLSLNGRTTNDLSRHKKRVATGLTIVMVVFYIVFGLNYKVDINDPLQQDISYLTAAQSMDIFSDTALNHYTETLIGTNQEPLSFIIVAKTDEDFVSLFTTAGWTLADQVSFKSIYNIAKAALFNEAYDTAPMTPDFWNGQVNNFGFEKSTATASVRQRHHARFWRTNIKTAADNNIYAGTVSLDVGIKWLVTHKISPAIDTEREYLFNDLTQHKGIMYEKKEKFVDSILGQNFSGDQFFTDGKLYILELK